MRRMLVVAGLLACSLSVGPGAQAGLPPISVPPPVYEEHDCAGTPSGAWCIPRWEQDGPDTTTPGYTVCYEAHGLPFPQPPGPCPPCWAPTPPPVPLPYGQNDPCVLAQQGATTPAAVEVAPQFTG